ncbi:MAG: zinc ribbon domain-containing protein [Candidatus Heimdallarchaeota archaeon]
MILDVQNIFHNGEDHGIFGIFENVNPMWILMIGMMVLLPLLAIWAYRDASHRDENAALWIIVIFFTMGMGIILYLIFRAAEHPAPVGRSYPAEPQPVAYGSSTRAQYAPPIERTPVSRYGTNFCEVCGAKLEATDSFCPKCGSSVKVGK